MQQQLTVKEQFSSLLKIIAYVSGTIAVIFFVTYLLVGDPLWKGIFRFIAFIGFIGLVFSFLRLREGQKEVHFELADEKLKITYWQKSEVVKEEFFDQETIKDIYKKEHQSFGTSLLIKGYEYIITFTDTENKLPMLEYSGRNLHFSEEESTKIDQFVEEIK